MNTTSTTYFTERVVLLLFAAAIASIGFFSFQRQQLFLNRNKSNIIRTSHSHRSTIQSSIFGTSTTMVLSHLLYAINLGDADASAEECVAAASSSKPPIHLKEQDELSLSSSSSIAKAITVEGVQVPGHQIVDGIPLLRNGHGLRSLTYFGIGIRIYVASMYTTKPILTAEQAMLGDDKSNDNNNDDKTGPIQLDFTFLRYVRQGQVVSAWTQQLDHSVTYKDYEGYEADKNQFIELASGGPIENQGTQSIVLVGDETRIIDQGKLTGVIQGRNFQKAFLSMWFGSMAVAEDLKANLLLGDEHLREEQKQQQEFGQRVQNELQQQTLVKA